MSSTSAKWGCCSIREKGDHFVKCIKCETLYHFACVFSGKSKQSKVADFSKTWVCPQCNQATPKAVKDDNTPVRQESSSSRSKKRQAVASPEQSPQMDTDPDSPITRQQVREIMEEVLVKHMSEFKNQFSAKLATITDEIKNVQQAVDYMDNRIEDVVKVQKETQSEVRLMQERENDLLAKIHTLEAKLNIMEQNARYKNVEIQCVPEKKTENLISIVEDISIAIGCTIKKENILRITRTAKQDPKSKRPRSIVVEFNSQLKRDEFLASTIQFNRRNPNDKLNSTHLGHSGPKMPIYVSEHLSPYNKALHAAARRAAKEKGYEFVWTRNGRVFMRKDANSEYIIVRDMSTIANLK